MTFGINDPLGHGKTAKSDQQVLSSKDDREFILRPHLWPNKTNLPLKNVNRKGSEGDRELGFILVEDGAPPFIVYNGLMYRDPATLPQVHYSSVDEMLADGWIVD